MRSPTERAATKLAVIIRCATLLLLAAFSCSCFRRELYVASKSPDYRTELRIWWILIPPDGRIEATLTHGEEYLDDLSPSPDDWIPGVVEVHWSAGSPNVQRHQVVVFICNDLSSQPFTYGYDLQRKQAIPADLSVIRSNLMKRYGLRDEDLARFQQDPLRWACDSAVARERFRSIIGANRLLPQ